MLPYFVEFSVANLRSNNVLLLITLYVYFPHVTLKVVNWDSGADQVLRAGEFMPVNPRRVRRRPKCPKTVRFYSNFNVEMMILSQKPLNSQHNFSPVKKKIIRQDWYLLIFLSYFFSSQKVSIFLKGKYSSRISWIHF